jgi:hypothetical protein
VPLNNNAMWLISNSLHGGLVEASCCMLQDVTSCILQETEDFFVDAFVPTDLAGSESGGKRTEFVTHLGMAAVLCAADVCRRELI